MHTFISLTAGSAATGTSENKRKSCDSGGLASAILLLLLVSWKTCGTAGWSQDVAGVSAVTSTAWLDDDVVDESDASLGLDQFSSAEDIQAKTWRDLLQIENVHLNVTAVMSEIYVLLLRSLLLVCVMLTPTVTAATRTLTFIGTAYNVAVLGSWGDVMLKVMRYRPEHKRMK